MQSMNIRQIKAAIRDRAFIGNVRVSCPMGRVVAIRRRKGQLLALIYGWGRWYSVKSVSIEGPFVLPANGSHRGGEERGNEDAEPTG